MLARKLKIQTKKEKIYVGYFKDEIIAALEYNKKAKELFDNNCFLNNITKVPYKLINN